MTAATCRECATAFDRAPGTPRVCANCLPAFKARLVREGTPNVRYRFPEEVFPDAADVVARVKRAARTAARLATASPSRETGQDQRLSR